MPKQSSSPRALAPMVNQQRGPTPRASHANYATMDEIPMGEDVLAGMFFLNKHHINILFDYGVSHDFMSCTCAMKAMLSLVALGAPYMISTPGGRLDADPISRMFRSSYPGGYLAPTSLYLVVRVQMSS
jgi:hypothetical protein